jgi:hypothetical protein
MATLMIDSLPGDYTPGILPNGIAGIHVAIEGREIAAGNINEETMTLLEKLAGPDLFASGLFGNIDWLQRTEPV